MTAKHVHYYPQSVNSSAGAVHACGSCCRCIADRPTSDNGNDSGEWFGSVQMSGGLMKRPTTSRKGEKFLITCI